MREELASASPEPDRPKVAVLSIRSDVVECEQDRSLEEMIFGASRDALAAAGVDRADLEGVVLSGNDQIDGRVISCMPSAGPAGGVDLDVTTIASSGEHALVYGYLRLLSGQGSNVLVVGWAKPSESVHPEHAELVSAEPYVLRAIGMNDTVAAALQASRLVSAEGPDPAETVCWPLTRQDLPAGGDAVFAAVLAVEESFRENHELCWIRGAGWSTDRYELGARDLAEQTALKQAVAHLASSGTAPDTQHWDASEIAAPSEPAVRAATDTLGLGDSALVNASGALASNPAPAHVAGLARLLAAAGLVGAENGSGEPVSLSGGVGLNGFAGQGATVMVFGKEKERCPTRMSV